MVTSGLSKRIARLVDLRQGEALPLVRSAAALFLILTSHAVLETARDSLLLRHLPARGLGAVYVAGAFILIPVAALTARWSARLGARSTLRIGLLLAIVGLAAEFLAPPIPAAIVAVYVLSGLVSGVLTPLYWSLVGQVLTAAGARRLVGLVAAAGTVGSVAGSGAALGLVGHIPVSALLLVSAALALAAIPVLPLPSAEPDPDTASEIARPRRGEPSALSDPFVRRVALLVAVSTSVFVVLDFFFKWTVARSIAPDKVSGFVARYYLLTNSSALVAQLVASRPLLRRLGVASTMLVTPLVALIGGAVASLCGGARPAVLLLKAADVTLRSSVHRTSLELAYLPLAPATRARAKPMIDGALARSVQALVGLLLLAAGVAGHLSALRLALMTLGLAGLWLAVARTIQKSYLGLLRRAIARDPLTDTGPSDPFDFQSAEGLVGYLSHEDEFLVVGAMNALARRGRSGLIPALVLLRPEPSVLLRALALFAASERNDWLGWARRLLHERRDPVRMAAARALAAHHSLDPRDVAQDETPRVRAYAALFLALERDQADPGANRILVEIIERPGPEGDDARLGLLSAVADSAPSDRLRRMLTALAATVGDSARQGAELARAVAAQNAANLLPTIIPLLARRDTREPVRLALLSFGATSLERLNAALHAPTTPRALRLHLPSAVARFGTKRAGELLLDVMERDRDGLVRYKALRALGRLVTTARIKVARGRVERLAQRNLLEYFRLLGLRAPFVSGPSGEADTAERILLGILDDKRRQSLERVFRLLKIAHPEEDLHRLYGAYSSDDKRVRDNAVELIYTLLRKADETTLAELLRIAGEERSIEEAVDLSRGLVPVVPPATLEEALDRLSADEDTVLVEVARIYRASRATAGHRPVGSTTEPLAGTALEASAPRSEKAVAPA